MLYTNQLSCPTASVSCIRNAANTVKLMHNNKRRLTCYFGATAQTAVILARSKTVTYEQAHSPRMKESNKT